MQRTTSRKMVSAAFVVLIVLSVLAVSIEAYPSWSHRQKRVSDQRLAELQTMLAIARLKNRLHSLPSKYPGFVDPDKIGRKKRSLSEYDSAENQMDYVEDEELEENNPEADVREELDDDIWRHNWLRRVANQQTRNNRKVKV